MSIDWASHSTQTDSSSADDCHFAIRRGKGLIPRKLETRSLIARAAASKIKIGVDPKNLSRNATPITVPLQSVHFLLTLSSFSRAPSSSSFSSSSSSLRSLPLFRVVFSSNKRTLAVNGIGLAPGNTRGSRRPGFFVRHAGFERRFACLSPLRRALRAIAYAWKFPLPSA